MAMAHIATHKRPMRYRICAWLMIAAASGNSLAYAFLSSPVSARVPSLTARDVSASDEETTKTSSTNPSSSSSSSSSSTSNDGDFSFFDEASIYVRAGSGGQGSSTYKKAKKGANGIPDGGSGGPGGNIVLTLDPSLNTLAGLSRRALRPNAFGGGGAAASSKRWAQRGGSGSAEDGDGVVDKKNFVARERLLSFRAEDGWVGGRMYDNGRGGEDCEVRVPPGTVVSVEVERILEAEDDDNVSEEAEEEDSATKESNEIKEYDLVDIGTISFENPSLIVARGGAGGEGTGILKNKKRGATRRGPKGGERHRIRLKLKLVADIALVGVPNAGKSTFLAAVTSAKPRIADYPFTTVVPNLGTWIPPSEEQSYGANSNNNNNNRNRDERNSQDRSAGSAGLILCDVPGLIAGASEGVGLGHAFLRHIERCRVILHLIDATGDDPAGDLEMVNAEISRYGSGSLANMPQVVVVNKMDAAWEGEDDAEQKREELADKLKETMGHTRLMWVSAKEKEGVNDLMVRMASYVDNIKEQQQNEVAAID
ncbi:hypothetical protein ACHAXR_007503 [Thalassiosira sp. AJA248-18]